MEDTESYYVYILTDERKQVLETGVSGALSVRLNRLKAEEDAGKALHNHDTQCLYLLYWEKIADVKKAMERAKEIKKWSRRKKEKLIDGINPQWNFLNEIVMKESAKM